MGVGDTDESHGRRARRRLRDPGWWLSVAVAALVLGALWDLGRAALTDDPFSLTSVLAVGLLCAVAAVGGELISFATTRGRTQ
ncbi:MAG TPA: hypothetical protein VI300_13070 [Solirubrobacter sp.]